MRVFAPRQFVRLATIPQIVGESVPPRFAIAGATWKGQWMDTPSTWIEQKRRDYNDVVHSKFLTYPGLKEALGPATDGWYTYVPYRYSRAALQNGHLELTLANRGWSMRLSAHSPNWESIRINVTLWVADTWQAGGQYVRFAQYQDEAWIYYTRRGQDYKSKIVSLRSISAYSSATFGNSVAAFCWAISEAPIGRNIRTYEVGKAMLDSSHYIVSACESFASRIGDGSATLPSNRIRTFSDLSRKNLFPSAPFLFHEDEVVGRRVDPLVAGATLDGSNYYRNWLVQHAYLDCLQNAPRLSDNSISNAMEIAGFIKSVVVDHKVEIPHSLQDLWLSYRYQYQTTKLDISDAITFVRRHMDLGSLDREITCYGTASTTFKDVDVLCRCTLKLVPKELEYLGRLWRSLYTYGLQPSFYVVWDSIPYSFIVDWLLPIGDITSVLDAERMYSGSYYNIRDVQFSLSYTQEVEGCTIRNYTRWLGSGPPELNGLYWFDRQAASSKVKGMRVLDAASLFMG